MSVGKPSKNGVLRLWDSGGTLRTLTCNLTSFQRKKSRAVTKTETYCTTEKGVGSPDVVYTGKAVWNGDANEIDATLDGLSDKSDAPSYYEWMPEGVTAGKVRYYGSGYVTDYSIGAATPGNVLVDNFTLESTAETRGVASGS